ncbi:MAG: PIN domain-containing protein [Micrococcales bacterium]|nr:PIN domain-containing protein [Micrococcales bacterium]OJX69670.1 MAG: VapC toxin family PIN domain ribonuclease [Micrococcales bacterium 72-143]
MAERYVFDASALLALLHGESGAQEVERLLEGGGACGAANWSEVAQKITAAGADWGVARAVLLSFSLTVEAVSIADAERAAETWTRGSGLSLADRLCLAVAHRLGAIAVTADTAWGPREGVLHIR